MKRKGQALGTLGAAVLGGALAAAYLAGASAATRPESSEPTPGPELLQLDDYCRHLYGDRSDAYQPGDVGKWRCSVWRNGVWGLEAVDLIEACHWQNGPDGQLKPREDGTNATRRELLCTL